MILLFLNFYYGIQQDAKLFLIFPVLCAVLRFIFIVTHHPYPSLSGRWRVVAESMQYGFWWGMDYNAYVFLVSMVIVSLPSVFIPAYAEIGDYVRIALAVVYGCILYAAYMGKLIFYKHFGDIYNQLVYMGNNADKHILLGIFFRQDRGGWILAGLIPYIALLIGVSDFVLSWPLVAYPDIAHDVSRYIFNTVVFLGAIAFYYWFRFGGTFLHRNKPEWDEIPPIVKEDVFMAKATVDDLVALKLVRQRRRREGSQRSAEELTEGVKAVLTTTEMKNFSGTDSQGSLHKGAIWDELSNPLALFHRTAQGARIKKPKHVFLIVGESIPGWSMTPFFSAFKAMDGIRALLHDSKAWTIPYVLPAGNVSRPSIVSLMSGLYDSQYELNEREAFWQGSLLTSFPRQMKELGYKSIYWYGGHASNGNFIKFGKAQGFDEVRNAIDFCGPNAPQTWVGVYDHVFLASVLEQLEAIDEPTFHFVYTTSNHGPYKISDSVLGFNPEQDIPEAPESIRKDYKRGKELATARYTDKALAEFIATIRERYPDSLLAITGDHSYLFGRLAGTEWLPRQWSLQERFCTVLTFLHPEMEAIQAMMGSRAETATHLQIMPTILEMLAPKGFRYYSVQPSLFDEQLPIVATPQQWFTNGYIGATGESRVEKLAFDSAQELPPVLGEAASAKYKAMCGKVMQDYRDLTGWIVAHADECVGK